MFEEKTIDLHGLDSWEATGVILNELFVLEENSDYKKSILFITGKGKGVLIETLLEILKSENYYYNKITEGSFRVYAKKEKIKEFF
ncbi:hypothetical protein [[Mycoplasma] mobile]|uniref:Smr domain-containing protein n=1 Tax=Mycoplasma mobile (strain ATCC 43663 / 163K / NCTC 11711) TaxID=267748 RepID=Q6KHP0_MYCM1|nr:hypothetical protein [[Mycoplasma] mobile]AAT27890.1 conserved hypothetical protein [Mycoplasma mobile 163K]